MSRRDIIGKHKTIVESNRETGVLSVRYHNTEVVRRGPDGMITLNTGGWRTKTTKTRMNQASIEFGLGFYVYQENFGWFVEFPDGSALEFPGLPNDAVTFPSPVRKNADD